MKPTLTKRDMLAGCLEEAWLEGIAEGEGRALGGTNTNWLEQADEIVSLFGFTREDVNHLKALWEAWRKKLIETNTTPIYEEEIYHINLMARIEALLPPEEK